MEIAYKYGIPTLGILIFLITFILLFRQQIAKKIEGMTHASKTGVTFGGPEQQQATPAKTPQTRQELDDFMAGTRTQTILSHEAIIQRDLDHLSGSDTAYKERILIRALAAQQVKSSFDQTLSVMWHSQFSALQHLNGHPNGVPVDEIKKFYDAGKQNRPDFYENYDFDKWGQFVLNSGLAELRADMVHITIRGREFLQYVVSSGRPIPSIA